jgi:DNA-directed RNA polymerase subunit RPC12/RpoP
LNVAETYDPEEERMMIFAVAEEGRKGEPMDNREAVNWLTNVLADIGKAEHSDLWHYEQALTEIKDMLESAQPVATDTNVGDTISRQAAIDALDCINGAEEVLRSLPPVQPERKKGEWIEISSINHTYKCSECGRLLVNVADGRNNVSKHYPYCHCGAKMRGEKDE